METTGISGSMHLVEHGHDRRLVEHRDIAHAVGITPVSSASAMPWPTPMHMVASA